jgi:hypothetical protein
MERASAKFLVGSYQTWGERYARPFSNSVQTFRLVCPHLCRIREFPVKSNYIRTTRHKVHTWIIPGRQTLWNRYNRDIQNSKFE